MSEPKLTVAIPTFRRGEILIATIERLLELAKPADAIIVVDQTDSHPESVAARLAAWQNARQIEWIRIPRPSIPNAMNVALLTAATELVLFLDDDIIPDANLIAAHKAAHDESRVWCVAGQVLQPGESPGHFPRPQDDLAFHFNHDSACEIANVMAGNLSVVRRRAIEAGGFDCNFEGAAYRFESDFARRVVEAGGVIRFEPAATLRHLHLQTGGLRAWGDHRSSSSPAHSSGDYYYALRHRNDFVWYALRRLRRNVLTRWHLRHPWAIPTKLVGEMRGLLRARELNSKGPSLIVYEGPDAGE